MAAVQTAFEHARRMGADALVLLDGDSQHDPSDVDGLVEPILSGDADMVVGSRFAGVRNGRPSRNTPQPPSTARAATLL